MQKVSGKFIASNAASCDLNLGFIPDKFTLIVAVAGTILVYVWHRILARAESDGQYGILDTGGTKTLPTTEATGIIAYSTQVRGVKIPAPDGITETNPDGYVKVPAGDAAAAAATISDWSTDVNYNTTGQDRSASVVGTVVRPPVHNGRVYELTTGISATGGTEVVADWDVSIGESVTDCNANVWLCREEITCEVGCKGVEIGATVMVNSDVCIYEAELHEEQEDKGDADLSNPI